MNKIIKIENYLPPVPHKVSEVICINCMNRYIDVRPCITLLKELKCPKCNKAGYIIETGEAID